MTDDDSERSESSDRLQRAEAELELRRKLDRRELPPDDPLMRLRIARERLRALNDRNA